MANQSFIYDSDETNPNRNNPFNVEGSALIRAAGLTQCVPLYMAVGECLSCGVNDVLWEPVYKAGCPAEICDTNNLMVISIPGKYAFGNPTLGPLTLTGNVNITKEEKISAAQLSGISCSSGSDPCESLTSGLQTSW
jgi:hypothetical protein